MFSNLRMTLCGLLLLLFSGALAAKATKGTVEKQAPDIFIKKLNGGSLPAEYDATQVTYALLVPENYDANRKYGLILGISPGNGGGNMLGPFKKAAQKYELFVVAPNNAGNKVHIPTRGQIATDTLADVQSKYSIDPKRIFVTGFSGGGRMSTNMVRAFPNRFAGHLPLGGVYGGPGGLDKLKTAFGHYLFAGETCFNRPESERALKQFQAAKIPAKLLIGPGKGHATPNADQGLEMMTWFYDRIMEATLPGLRKRYESAEDAYTDGRIGTALKLFLEIAGEQAQHDLIAKAGQRVTTLQAEAQAKLQAAQSKPAPEAMTELEALQQTYAGTPIAKEAKAAFDKIAADPATKQLLAKRKAAQYQNEAQAAWDAAEKLEQSARYPLAIARYRLVAKKYADLPLAAKATQAAERLAKDPKVLAQAQDAAAAKLWRRANNYFLNNLTAQARAALEQLIKECPESKYASQAKAKLKHMQ